MSTETIQAPVTTKEKIQQTDSELTAPTYLKGGHFLVGDTPAEDIFISEEFTEEQLMIKEMVIEFCVQNLQTPFFERGRELEISKPEDKAEVVALLKKAGELGLCGVSIPEEYNGMGLDFNTGVLFSEAIAAGFSFATTLGAQTSIGSLPIVFYGNEAQKQKYLPGIATGELVAAYALTEPTAGSDANSGKTKATLAPDGKHYLINGQKIWITNGGIADVFVVFAKIDNDKNLSAFIVERDFPGLTIGHEEKKMGIKGSSTVQLFFDNCKVPVENMLNEREAGFKMALNILNTGRIKLGAGGVGGGKFSLERAVKFATERKQFGQAISNFGAIKYKIGDIATSVFALDAALYRTGRNIDLIEASFKQKGMSDGEAKLSAVREFAVECSILKTKGSILACYATDETLQIHGGMGYAVETGLEMAYRDARITKIYEGTNDVNRMLSVAELTKRGLQTKEINLIGAGKKIPGFLFQQMLPFGNGGKWGQEETLVQGIKNTFLLISGTAGKKMGKKLVEEQEIILNLADILAEAYVCESALLKIKKLNKLSASTTEKLEIQQKMMQLYLYEAVENVKNSAKQAIDSFATGLDKKSLHFAVNKMLKNYDQNPKELRRAVADYVIKNGGYTF